MPIYPDGIIKTWRAAWKLCANRPRIVNALRRIALMDEICECIELSFVGCADKDAIGNLTLSIHSFQKKP